MFKRLNLKKKKSINHYNNYINSVYRKGCFTIQIILCVL